MIIDIWTEKDNGSLKYQRVQVNLSLISSNTHFNKSSKYAFILKVHIVKKNSIGVQWNSLIVLKMYEGRIPL